MQIHHLGDSAGITVAAEQGQTSSSAGVQPGSPEAFAHFHPHTAGALVPLGGGEDVFFDAHSSFSSVDAADLPSHEEADAQHRSLRTLLPDLMTSLASLRDGATHYIKTKTKEMADNSMGGTANIEAKRQIAEEHGCHLASPFHQSKFLFEKTVDDSEFAADYSRAGGGGHGCFGLSVNWCQSRAKGQSDEVFFDKLANYREDALLPRVLGFQHIEQQPYRDKIRNAGPMLLDTLPKLGMTLGKAPDGVRPAHYGMRMDAIDHELKSVLKPGTNQTFLLLSESHAMALHQDSQNRLHFFDPLFGVVQSDNRENMSSFLCDVFKRDAGNHWRGENRSLQLSEVVPGPAFHLR
ncbi:cysteine protease domain, YopT-type [Pseudomonas sp. GM50]|uniref:YopT-type cysteine protease domain-containing protein n=1 Tax=Pseudomonas sp. GM50 TaxID=1144332 RepID=UPI000270D6FA|nr:YopT-type cysteine protease domain-containing protein [Pseudomonas sp. GM50]EJM64378.1 cysteine protease domain, YopT-type [Pseudomonas sp. GM50]